MKVHPIVDVQLECSLASRGPEKGLFDALASFGISSTLYGVLSRGLLTGSQPEIGHASVRSGVDGTSPSGTNSRAERRGARAKGFDARQSHFRNVEMAQASSSLGRVQGDRSGPT